MVAVGLAATSGHTALLRMDEPQPSVLISWTEHLGTGRSGAGERQYPTPLPVH
jgi:hypothetical protein